MLHCCHSATNVFSCRGIIFNRFFLNSRKCVIFLFCITKTEHVENLIILRPVIPFMLFFFINWEFILCRQVLLDPLLDHGLSVLSRKMLTNGVHRIRNNVDYRRCQLCTRKFSLIKSRLSSSVDGATVFRWLRLANRISISGEKGTFSNISQALLCIHSSTHSTSVQFKCLS